MSETGNIDNATADSSAKKVDWRLSRAWQREVRFTLMRGLGHMLLVAAGLVAVNFAVDWAFDLPGLGRRILLFTDIGVLLAVFYVSLVRHLRAYDPVRVALQVERLYPQLKSLLVSYVQLRDRTGDGSVSAALIRAMCRQAIDRIRSLDFGKIVRFRTLKRVALFCVIVLGLGAGAGLWRPAFLHAFVVRMVSPGSTVEYPTETLILSVKADPAVVQMGRRVTLLAEVGGRKIPNDGLVYLRPEGVQRDTRNVRDWKDTGRGTRVFAFQVDDTSRNFTFRFRLGDALSKEHSVEVIPPPQIQVRLVVSPPEYTKLKEAQAEMLSPKALRGSTLTWHLKADRALRKAVLVSKQALGAAGPGKELNLDVSAGDQRTAAGKLEAVETLDYSFRVTDREHDFTYDLAVPYRLDVVPDKPPEVTLIAPSQDEKATAQKQVDISFNASDDYGMVAYRIIYMIEKKGTVPAYLPEAGRAAGAAWEVCKQVDLKEMQTKLSKPIRWDVQKDIEEQIAGSSVKKVSPKLEPGDVVRYAVEVLDNCTGPAGQGAGQSKERRLTIVSTEEYLRLAAEERARILKKIKELQVEERQRAESVRKLSGGYQPQTRPGESHEPSEDPRPPSSMPSTRPAGDGAAQAER